MRVLLFDEVRATADFFTNIWRDELEKEGHQTFTIHMQHFETCKSDLIDFLSVRPDIAICYNNAAFSLEVIPGENFWDTLGTPVVNILFDHPGTYWPILENAPKVMIPACEDRNHLKYLERFFPDINKGIFLPHFGYELSDEVIPWEERPIDVLYVGSPSYPGTEIDEFAQNVIDILSKENYRTVESAIEQTFGELQETQYSILFPDIANMIAEVDLYSQVPKAEADDIARNAYLEAAMRKYHYLHVHITSGHRRMLVKQLVEAGIDVYAFSGWQNETELLANPHFHFGGTISPMECVEKMRESKIVLNSMPWFKDGNHDRICHGMLQKSVVVTEDSEYIKERFTNGEELMMFSLDDLEKGAVVPKIVKDILSDPESAELIAEKGYSDARIHDTVVSRINTLFEELRLRGIIS